MNELATKFADHAAIQSDRWLFCMILVVLLTAVYFAFRWLVGRLEKQTTLLEGLFKEANEGRVKCAEQIAGCSVVINECKDTICDCRETMEKCTDFLRRKVSLILLGVGLCLASGCTVIRKKEQNGATLFYGSWGTDKRVESIEYDKLKIKGLNVNQTKGVKAAGEGVTTGFVKGAKGMP